MTARSTSQGQGSKTKGGCNLNADISSPALWWNHYGTEGTHPFYPAGQQLRPLPRVCYMQTAKWQSSRQSVNIKRGQYIHRILIHTRTQAQGGQTLVFQPVTHLLFFKVGLTERSILISVSTVHPITQRTQSKIVNIKDHFGRGNQSHWSRTEVFDPVFGSWFNSDSRRVSSIPQWQTCAFLPN